MVNRTEPVLQLRATAYHEAGHAVVAVFQRYAPAIRRVTITRTGDCLGSVDHYRLSSFHPDSRSDLKTQARLEARAIVMLGGPAAEARFRGRRNHKGHGPTTPTPSGGWLGLRAEEGRGKPRYRPG